jgi:hypothetical protein
MFGRALGVLAILVCIGALQSTPAVAEGETTGDPQAQMMEMMKKYATPSDQHRRLEPLVGMWQWTSQFWMQPGAAPESSAGKATYSWAHGGRYIMQDVQGEAMGMPFAGTGVMGYDRFNEEYFSVWFDNMSTGYMSSTGRCDASGKVFTMEGTYDDYWSGQKDKWSKSVLRIDGPDKHTLTMFDKAPDGTEYKSFELVYTRAAMAEK